MSSTKAQVCQTLKDSPLPFGPGSRQKLAFFPRCVCSMSEFEDMKLGDALDALDGLLFSFEITTNSTSSAESDAHRKLGVDKLRRVSRDRLWLDELLNTETAGWGDVNASDMLLPQEYTLAEAMGGSRGVVKEVSEATVDLFAAKDADIANMVCYYMPSVGPDAISSEPQKSTRLPSGGSVHPDVNFYAARDNNKHLFERRENKTLQVMVHHAHELEEVSESALEAMRMQAIRGIVTQAYASSTSTTKVCKVVWMGHPSLYRVAYIYGQTLFVSDWRSAEPQRIKDLLQLHKPWSAPISQAHFIRETLVLASIDSDKFDEFIKRRQKPNLSTVLTKFMRALQDPFDILSRILLPRLILGDDSVHGCPRFLGEHFALKFPNTVKPRFVWSNAAVVAKAVASEEFKVWESVAHLSGIPTLLGSMVIQTAPNRGQTGNRWADEKLDPEEGTCARAKLSTIIRDLHKHDFHHHALHGLNGSFERGEHISHRLRACSRGDGLQTRRRLPGPPVPSGVCGRGGPLASLTCLRPLKNSNPKLNPAPDLWPDLLHIKGPEAMGDYELGLQERERG
ncbi:hypothetical protein DFH09DRAFT_1277745 [Mycena vulgaris]|nr:hypothetical protein DFH09DRAFT_1277745 [Mycena vulgaris]